MREYDVFWYIGAGWVILTSGWGSYVFLGSIYLCLRKLDARIKELKREEEMEDKYGSRAQR